MFWGRGNPCPVIDYRFMKWSVIDIETENIMIIPLWKKFLLTIDEASKYFGIGVNKLHVMANEYVDSDYKFVIQNGSRKMINREKFEEFLNNTSAI